MKKWLQYMEKSDVMTYTMGIDIGGTKIAAILMDQREAIKYRVEVKSNPISEETMFQQVVYSIEKLIKQANISLKNINGIGVGVPGKIDRENGIAIYQNNLPWRHFPIVERLKEHFPIEHVVIDNDVHLAAWAEWIALEKKKSVTTFVYVTISTGISCAIIQNGKFIRGNGFAGELGLIPVNNHTGHHVDKLENIASGPAIAKHAQEVFSDQSMTTEKLFLAYEQNDPRAKKVVSHITEPLAHGIYTIISLLDPQYIVFGGGIVNNQPFIIELLRKRLQSHLIPAQHGALDKLATSIFRKNSGAIGAAQKALITVNKVSP